MSAAMGAYEALVDAARGRHAAAREGKTRVVAQVGHCSQAVGAEAVAAAIAEALQDQDDSYLAIAGCDGACFAAPQVSVATPDGVVRAYRNMSVEAAHRILAGDVDAATPYSAEGDAFFGRQRRVTLAGCGEMDATDIDEYVLGGGYAGLARALSGTPQEVIDEVKASGLRGRGGAYFPAALKWQGARSVGNEPRYLVANCEEGEPGIFKDRHLMEGAPHRLLEGAIIAAYAAGVNEAYIYINAEANLSDERVQGALEQAYANGLLGADILASGFSLDMRIMRGAGGYVCGDETTLLNTMEGYRREPRQRPPFPTEAGLWEQPTVINNAETLCSVPYILANGADAFAAIGTDADKGTKIVSLSGSVRRAGVAEVAMGATLRYIIEEVGGGAPEGRALTAIAVGGPSSGILPASMIDTAIKPGFIHESGVMLGAGGVIALDDRLGALGAMRALAAYNARESCGKCTPCREGTPRMVEMIDRLVAGKGSARDMGDLRELAELVNAASLCGLGQAAGNPALSALRFWGDELAMMNEG